MKILQIQTAFFFKEDFTRSFEELSLKIKGMLGESFATQQLPVPADAPADFPRLTLTYEGRVIINVGKNRLDFFYNDFALIKDDIIKVFDVMPELGLKIGRIGFVKNIFMDGGLEDMKNYVAAEKVSRLGELKEISIRVNVSKNIGGFKCNDIQNIINGKINQDGFLQDGLIVVRDVNTLAESLSDNDFTKDELKKIIEYFDSETNDLLL